MTLMRILVSQGGTVEGLYGPSSEDNLHICQRGREIADWSWGLPNGTLGGFQTITRARHGV